MDLTGLKSDLTMIDTFAGIGGFSLAAKLVGNIKTTQFIEIDQFCQKILAKNFPNTPIHDDIKTFTARPFQWDVLCGGFPCQDLSVAGKRAGITKESRSGLFYELMRVVRMVRPKYIVLENVAAILNNGLDIVLGELSEAGYDAEWSIISASSLGACHKRSRWWLVAYPNNYGSFATEKSRSLKKTNGRAEKRENQAINIEGSGEPKHSKAIQLNATDSNSDGHQGRCTETRNKITSRQDSQIIGSTNTSELKRCTNDGKDKGESRIDENLSRSSDGREAMLTEPRGVCDLSKGTNDNQRINSQNKNKKDNNRTLVSERQSGIQLSEHRELERNKTIFKNNSVRQGDDNYSDKRMDNQNSITTNTDSIRRRGGNSERCSVQGRTVLSTKQKVSEMGSKTERCSSFTADSNSKRLQRKIITEVESGIWRTEHTRRLDPNWRQYVSKPILPRGSDGLSNRVDRTKALGNSVVPQVAAIPLQRVCDLYYNE